MKKTRVEVSYRGHRVTVDVETGRSELYLYVDPNEMFELSDVWEAWDGPEPFVDEFYGEDEFYALDQSEAEDVADDLSREVDEQWMNHYADNFAARLTDEVLSEVEEIPGFSGFGEGEVSWTERLVLGEARPFMDLWYSKNEV